MAGIGSEAVGPGLAALPIGLARLAIGPSAIFIAIGLIGAGLLASVVISLSSAWAWAELFRWPHSLNMSIRAAPGFYAVYLIEVIPAAVIALVATDLLAVVINAMILNVLVLAVPLAFLVRLSGDRVLLGPLANGQARSVLSWAITVALLGLGVWSALGAFGLRP